jgi:hypothetical protein
MRRNSDRPACVATRERPKPQRSCLSCSAKPSQNPHSHSGQCLTDQSTLARFESVGAPGRIPRLLRLKRPSSFEHLTRVIEQPDMCQDCAKAIVSMRQVRVQPPAGAPLSSRHVLPYRSGSALDLRSCLVYVPRRIQSLQPVQSLPSVAALLAIQGRDPADHDRIREHCGKLVNDYVNTATADEVGDIKKIANALMVKAAQKLR